MVLNLDKLKKLVEERFEGNKSKFARAIKIDRGQLSKILSEGKGAGKDFFCGFYCYCKKEKLNFDDYFFANKCENN